MDFTPQEIDELNEKLEDYSAGDRIKWAYETYGQHLVLSTSFGIQAAVMLHMATRVAPEMPIIFIDTGYLFKETYIFANELTQQLNLNIKKYHAKLSAAEQEALYGKLWEQGIEGLEKYNFIRKVEPMNRAISELGAKAWLAGLRRSQANSRGNLGVLKLQNRVMKIHPIIDWTDRDVYRYITKNDLTYHPLWEQGYVSVGDWHSTTKLEAGMSEEQTRFGGLKRECGLHELSTKSDFQI